MPDVNVLLALAWSNHPHHGLAHAWFAANAALGWATCLLTQTAFVRLSLNQQVVGVAVDCQAAVSLLQGLVVHPHHRFLEVAPALAQAPFHELIPRIQGYRQITDATLLFVARFHGFKLVTIDQAVAALCPWNDSLHVITP